LLKRLLIGLVILVVLAVVGIGLLAWRPAIAPVDVQAASAFPPELVAQGEKLAAAGNCSSCHTVKGGAQYAGGLGLDSGFGTIYSANITPDPETGIGRWSEEAFARALREGVERDGSQLFPAFPFDHFTKVRAEDVKALYAFLMTRAPVQSEPPANTLPFPYNIRALQAGWKLLFLKKGEFVDDPAKSAEWNRGAYLAEGLAHCSACHTPRNAAGAEKTNAAYAGATIEGWYAPAINAAPTSPVPWTQDEFFGYLRSGGTALHGSAAGSMSEVVHDSLAQLPDADVHALAAYFADVSGASNPATGEAVAKALAFAHRDIANANEEGGAHIYAAACASCHYNDTTPLLARPELALNSALSAPDASNLVHVILEGIGRADGMPNAFMPGFSHSFSDAEIAELAAYLRSTRTDQPAWKDLDATIAKIRKGEKT
jgi:mono/diheme cytochrome c family protein